MKNKMMRMLLLGLSLLLICRGVPAAGEGLVSDLKKTEPVQVTAEPFSFRNGVQWLMDSKQVQATETVPMVERSQGEWSVLYPQSKVQVSRFSGYLAYIFHQNQLRMIMYEFEKEPDSTYAYLRGALKSVYGETEEAEAQEVVMIMDQLYPGRYSAEQLKEITRWSRTDGTRIYLYRYSETAFAILYAEALTAGNGQFNTSGL